MKSILSSNVPRRRRRLPVIRAVLHAVVVLLVSFFISHVDVGGQSGGSIVSSFQLRAPLPIIISRRSKLISFSSSSSSSAASKWMENEKRLEQGMEEDVVDAAAVTTTTTVANSNKQEQTTTNTATTSSFANYNSNNNNNNNNTPLGGRWEELHGNYILRPQYPSSSSSTSTNTSRSQQQQQPRALIHFLGGALLGAAPQLSYRYLLERLSSRGYLVVATPYQLSFDHLNTCDEIIERFELVAPDLARQYGAVPVVGLGHSCGSLLHMLITSLFPDTPRAANAFISYNNRGVGEAVPFFEELIVPLFSDKSRNGSTLMKALIAVAREKYNGQVPSDSSLLNLLQSIPTPIPGLTNALFTSSLVSIPTPLRQSLTNFVTEPTFNALSNTGLPSLLLQSLDITQQIPKLIDEVEQGARDFVPSPEAMSSAARRAYRCRRTLLLQFNNDELDDSELLEGYLKEAESVMKTKRPMIAINLERKVLEGNHLTPLLGPSGGEEWGQVLEETLGSVLGLVDGWTTSSSTRTTTTTTDDNSGGELGDDGESRENRSSSTSSSSSSVKAVRERLGYEQVERVVDELVAWLDEGSL